MSKRIPGTHILLREEYACKHCGALPPAFYDEEFELGLEYQVLFRAFEFIREGRGGKALAVNSGYRCLKHEQAMYDAWVKGGKKGAPKAFTSVHLFGLALDLQATSKADQMGIVELARLVKPAPRIGWKQYRDAGSLLVHIDYGYLISPIYSKDLDRGVEF